MPEQNLFVVPCGIAGIIRMYCIAPDGSIRDSSRITVYNRVLNAGLDALMGANVANQFTTLTNWAAVGDSSTAVADGQTALQNPISLDGVNARTSTTYTGDAASAAGGVGPDYYGSYTVVRKFNAATTNCTVREVGFASASSGGTMWNRAIVSPDYSVLTGEELVVSLESRFYVPNADASGTFSLSGVSYNYTVRALNAQSAGTWGAVQRLAEWTNTLNAGASTTAGLVAATAAGPSSTNPASGTALAYTNGNYYRDVEWVWDPATITTSISWFKFWNGRLQVAVSAVSGGTAIPKNSTNRLKLTFRHQFTRITL